MEAFKNLHKECEQLKTSGFSTAEIRRVKIWKNSTTFEIFFWMSVLFFWFCGLTVCKL